MAGSRYWRGLLLSGVGCVASASAPPPPILAAVGLSREGLPEAADALPADERDLGGMGDHREAPQAQPGADPQHATAESEPAARRLTLPQLLALCLQQDPRLAAARAAVAQAVAEARTAAQLPNPILAASGTTLPFPGHPFSRTNEGGPPQLDVSLGYAVDTWLFGKVASAGAAARHGVDAAIADYAEQVRRRLEAAIAAFHEVVERRELVALAALDGAQLEGLRTVTERRLALGGISQIELERLQVALASSQRRLLSLQVGLLNSRARLQAEAGQAPLAAPLEPEMRLPNAGGARPTETTTVADGSQQQRVLWERARAQRPDLLALVHRLTQAEASVRQERRAALPSLHLSLGYARQFQRASLGLPDIGSLDAGFSVSLPVVDLNRGPIGRAEAQVQRLRAQLKAAQIQLWSELGQALASLKLANSLLGLFDAGALSAASIALQHTSEGYRLGGRTLLEVLDAQTAYRDVYRDYVQANVAQARAQLTLRLAVGGAPLSPL